MIAVVDYGMGNLRSVAKALERVGGEVEITSDPGRIDRAAAVVLPGVGAFGRCMENLERAGLSAAVRRAALSGRPFFGICVGMQLLFEESEEYGPVAGLGVLPGRVRRLRPPPGMKVPHMGWNRISIVRRPPILTGIPDGAYMYFVHSYAVDCGDPELVATTTVYGGEFASSVARGNLFASQFHPEKSQDVGLKLLANFVAIVQEGKS